MIYLDNAATSWPKPEPVYQTLESFLRSAGANPGRGSHRMAVRAAAGIADTRQKLARLLGVSEPNRVIFCSNTTDALNLAIKGLLRPGDHAVTTDMEHNSVRRPLRSLELAGVKVTRVAANAEGFVAVEQIREALQSNTRLVAICHASNVNGAIQPLEKIAEVTRAQGTLLLVDGAQTVGALPFDFEGSGADLLAFPGHKALMGPPGTGSLVIGRRVDLEQFATVREGGTGGNSEEDVQPAQLPARYEAGTLNTVGIAALGAALDVVAATGLDAIWHHEREMTTRLIDGLRALPGVTVLSPSDEEARAAVVSFLVDGWEPIDFGAALDQAFEVACRTGLHCAPDACRALGAFPYGTVRFSPGYYTTVDEIDQAVAAVGELAKASLQMPR